MTRAIFHEEQNLRQARQITMLATPPVGLLFLTIWQVVLGHSWGRQPMSNGALIGWTIFAWLLFLRLTTVRLVTDVFPSGIRVALRGAFLKRTIPLASIRSATTLTYHPIRDFGGYGVRSGQSGKAWIARGTSGVRFELREGDSVLIGSQKSSDLAAAVCDLLRRGPAPR